MAAPDSRRIASATTLTIGGVGSGTKLFGVLIDTGAAGSLTIQEKDSNGETVAIINTANTVSLDFKGRVFANGIFVTNSATGGAVILYE